jgi:hypothetical protein
LEQDLDFARASGALAAICYREEIEAALRTKGFGGFQLLDLQDFPGQGTALDGMLDAYMDSKGATSPEAWRELCSETVPLVRFPKYAWTTDETFEGRVEVAKYGPSALPRAVLRWSLQDAAGKEFQAGRIGPRHIGQGTVSEQGVIQLPLGAVPAPERLRLCVEIQGATYRNHYDFWTYPRRLDPALPTGVTVARSLDEPTLRTLVQGGKVLLLPEPAKLANSVEGFFASDCWCYPMFRSICEGNKAPPAPGTLGLLIQDKHPALARFPTEFHSGWQWWPTVMNSRAIVLGEAPASYRSIVQVIDNFERNHKLGLLFEAKVGQGRLLVCCADLPSLQDRPEARQLWASLLAYAGSESFSPSQELAPEMLSKLVR